MRQASNINQQVHNNMVHLAVGVVAAVVNPNQARQVFRRAAAVGFYNAYAGYQIKTAKKRVTAIDFRRAIQVEELAEGKVLQQFYGDQRGRFYSEQGECSDRLGVADYYLDRDGSEKKKKVGLFVTTQPVTVLKSVAAPCVDNWSNPSKPCLTCGGGRQLFVPRRELNRHITPIAPNVQPVARLSSH